MEIGGRRGDEALEAGLALLLRIMYGGCGGGGEKLSMLRDEADVCGLLGARGLLLPGVGSGYTFPGVGSAFDWYGAVLGRFGCPRGSRVVYESMMSPPEITGRRPTRP